MDFEVADWHDKIKIIRETSTDEKLEVAQIDDSKRLF